MTPCHNIFFVMKDWYNLRMHHYFSPCCAPLGSIRVKWTCSAVIVSLLPTMGPSAVVSVLVGQSEWSQTTSSTLLSRLISTLFSLTYVTLSRSPLHDLSVMTKWKALLLNLLEFKGPRGHQRETGKDSAGGRKVEEWCYSIGDGRRVRNSLRSSL